MATTCSLVADKVESGEWTPIEGARALWLAAGDDYIPGVSPSLGDPDLYRLLGLIVAKGGPAVIKLVWSILWLVKP